MTLSGVITESSTTNVVSTPKSVEDFFDFCQKREDIRLKRAAGQPPPWTDDPIFQTYHFCNIRRQDDYGTVWYMENVLPEAKDATDLLWKTTLYRVVNNLDWFRNLNYSKWFEKSGVFGRHEWDEYHADILNSIEAAPPPYSPAHITLQSPDGKDRKQHLFQTITWLHVKIEPFAPQVYGADNLKSIWGALQQIPYVGPFIALQIYRDLILVGALPFSDDDFVYLGPGCRLGLSMIFPELKLYRQQYLALQEIRRINPLGLNLGDIEHSMCEAAKYWKLQGGKGRHRYYRTHLATN